MRILHVTEAMGGGIVSFVDSISRRQAEAGADVSVLYTVRPDTPARDVMEARFESRVTLLPPIDEGSTRRSVFTLMKETRRLARSGRFDAIHVHSSIAGVACRLALIGVKTPLFYSPHGFAFLRESASRPARAIYLWAERLFARKGTLIVTSATEVDLARKKLWASRVEYLQSGVPGDSLVARERTEKPRPQVTMTARITYQKAPWRFAAVARELSDLGEFVWVGGGPEHEIAEWIGDAPVTLLEWVTPEELEEIFARTDVFLFPSLWEGMALSLIQAQGRGLPAVTTDIVGNRDTVLHEKTGFVCATDEELVEATRRLLLDAELRARMGKAAVEHVRAHFTDDRIGTDSIALYEKASARQ
ncbi:glycosyltransferase [Microbacterium paludicola]|uniref:glycosyltransferase n=1 Tax=Microbacterium paludicola TaxID=300019 RepID=UPI0038796BD5